ncbi:GIY-YIG nuclease family protein [Leptolyngbya sp. CCNP1308]|uniref:GIY-YIG nuclease family protein n=1 Tax=Leptolyngbya sp. CCNP1308 TaxID=3110255 RepID=UPI002B1F7D7A|nr:GIY-YIG nuclease family protein [Leptolyngbya sp. CCNP1308]MEA5447971.1 GIY-YIG nuclease family protein [Leptolyngbya sp. CCNP1308]
MTCGVYLITCTATGDQYVGRSVQLEVRLRGHKLQLIKGTHPIPAMQELANKHGVESFTFEILAAYDTDFRLASHEREWIKRLQPQLNRTGTEKVRAKRQAEWTPEKKAKHSELMRVARVIRKAEPELQRQQQMAKAIEGAIAVLEQRVDFLGDGHRKRLEALSRREVLE